MSELFRAGDKVVCVDATRLDDSDISEGGEYTVSGVGADGLIELEGIDPAHGFMPRRFVLATE